MTQVSLLARASRSLPPSTPCSPGCFPLIWVRAVATGPGWLEQLWCRSPAPVRSATSLLAAPSVGSSFHCRHLDAGALWMLQGRAVAQPGAEQQRPFGVRGRHRGLWILGTGDRDSTGTYLG